ncbi:major facilitator superfamily domain-containing protein [Truncatella angustata]|uniref:Major facilitator superfamily domain-containing protein n=1 Tax=Truncatella angustata TaxID=152316 RepID=A0A9P8ZWJ5_9PEZI|nr:major facilitator superfamily domain-containing protein [Truncatella angustata]KAH6653101.1 major facilitator superfamily domain-containing protein [Truncatella angustata]
MTSDFKSSFSAEKAKQLSDPDSLASSAASSNPDLPSSILEQKTSKKGINWFLAYFAVIISVLLFALDATIVAVVQPQVLAAFDNEIDKLPWIGVAFSLGTIAILPLGKANGLFDVKWLFIASVAIFEIGSILCGAAPDMTAMIVGRAISGVGGAGIYCGGLIYISLITGERERPLYMSGVAVVWGIGSVLGPLIGGALAQSHLTWRWAFYINPVIAAALAPIFLLCMRSLVLVGDMPISLKLRNTDWAAIIVFCGGSVAYTMALTFGGSVYAFDSGSMIALWTVTGVLFIAFVAVTILHPLISAENRLYPSHFMRSVELNILQLQIFLAGGIMMTTIYYIPLLFQFTRGDGALQAGVRLLPLIGMVVFFSIANGVAMPYFGYHKPWYIFGNAMALTGSVLMYTSKASTPTSSLYGYTALIGMGVGSSITAGFAVVQAMVLPNEVNNAVGFMSIGQSMGQISILAIGGTLFQNIGFQRLAAILPDAGQGETLQILTGTSNVYFLSLSEKVQITLVEQVRIAITNVFALTAAASGIGLATSLFLTHKKLYSK